MKNKGITLLALIVTVIIMLILGTVTIKLVNDGGAIQKTKEAAKLTKEASEKEQLDLAIFTATDYTTGKIDLDILEENLPKDWKIDDSRENLLVTSSSGKDFIIEEEIEKINPEVLVEVEDEYGNKYTYYRLDKASKEDIQLCKKKLILPLLGDVNCDGIVDSADVTLVSGALAGSLTLTEKEKKYADINQDNDISGSDINMVDTCAKDKLYQRLYAIKRELGIDKKNTMTEDKENGKIYYIEDNVTEKQVKELEKYGVRRTLLGDMDLDGKLTQNDLDLMNEFFDLIKEPTDIQWDLFDINQDNIIDEIDLALLEEKINN